MIMHKTNNTSVGPKLGCLKNNEILRSQCRFTVRMTLLRAKIARKYLNSNLKTENTILSTVALVCV